MSPGTRKHLDAWNEYMRTVPCTRADCPMCDGYHYAHRMDVEVINEMATALIEVLKADTQHAEELG